jgi:hypothetical protein
MLRLPAGYELRQLEREREQLEKEQNSFAATRLRAETRLAEERVERQATAAALEEYAATLKLATREAAQREAETGRLRRTALSKLDADRRAWVRQCRKDAEEHAASDRVVIENGKRLSAATMQLEAASQRVMAEAPIHEANVTTMAEQQQRLAEAYMRSLEQEEIMKFLESSVAQQAQDAAQAAAAADSTRRREQAAMAALAPPHRTAPPPPRTQRNASNDAQLARIFTAPQKGGFPERPVLPSWLCPN